MDSDNEKLQIWYVESNYMFIRYLKRTCGDNLIYAIDLNLLLSFNQVYAPS